MKKVISSLFLATFFTSLFLITVVFPVRVEAAVMRTGDIVSVPKDAVVPGDFYALGGKSVNISGVIEGDLYAVGQSITINGTVMGDVVAIGGSVQIHGNVEDDVRVVSGSVELAEAVKGDVIVIGGFATVLSTATIDEDLYFYGGQLDVDGEVVGMLHVQAESLVINSSVGSVDATLSGAIQLGESAHIGKDILYESSREISRSPNAVVEGKITQREAAADPQRDMGAFLYVAFMALFSALVAVLLFRDYVYGVVRTSSSALGLSGFIGFAAFLMMPIAASVLLISVIGVPVGIFLWIVYLALVLAALILSQVFVGAALAKIIVHEYRINWMWTVAGVALTQAVLQVPYVGVLICAAVFFVVLGMLLHYGYTRMRA